MYDFKMQYPDKNEEFIAAMIKRVLFVTVKILFVSGILFSCSSYNIKQRGINGNTLLHEAVLAGDFSLVKKLIDKGADINSENDQSATPICIAAYFNRKEIVQYLIERGVNVNYINNDLRCRNSNLFKDNIFKYPEKKRNFFLTFDAGDDDANIDYILKTLKKYRITATFFITGKFLCRYSSDVKRILAEGHVIGNHTFNHLNNYKNEQFLIDELSETEDAYRRITGREITRIWRAPYLCHVSRPWMLKSARKLGYRHIDVSLYSKDWISKGERAYLSNEKFIKLFRKNMGTNSINSMSASGINYNNIRKKSTQYHGIIMLMHTGSYRKDESDFVYTLEDVILQVISCGFLFDNCKKFEDSTNE